ncbi:uncharacterized protein LOC125314188 [Rhodamnia argentea]|uniref:Uncharacterized protein LOC125314188 n=1 Tax=Rhodamnia argentea TaxID=178133 RepID=A0ABM3H4W0_9MYRT|nr:uncharacterized protein LOC125314188 [Rhodamnia argentea]
MRRNKEVILCKLDGSIKIVNKDEVEVMVTFMEEVVNEAEGNLLAEKVATRIKVLFVEEGEIREVNESSGADEKANLVNDGDQVLMLAFKENADEKNDTWYLDTGASNHMCGRKEIFVEIDETVKGKVSFGDNSQILVEGKGTILIHLKNGTRRFITNVYYVPKMSSNILSLGQLLEKGYSVHMKDLSLVLRDQNNRLIAFVKMSKNRMFTPNIKDEMSTCLQACIDNPSWLWHLRFGHLNFGGLNMLSRKKMVYGLPHIDHPDQLCEGCVIGKHSRTSFPKESTYRGKKPLESTYRGKK